MASDKELAPYKVAALDVGGTTIGAGIVGADKSVNPSEPRLFSIQEDDTYDNILDALVSSINSLRDIAGVVSGMGIAMPGPFDYEEGISLMEHKFKALYNQNIKKPLQERLSLPVYFVNDAEAFALGAWWTSEYPAERMLAITLGTGLGACFLAEGRAIRSGAEVPEGGELWNVPYKDGILEDFISRRVIERLYAEKYNSFSGGVKEIAQAAREGSKEAQEAFRAFAEHIGEGLAPHVTRFHPAIIVFGGQISKAFDLFGERASEVLRSKTGLDIPMVQTPLGDAAAVLGAGYHCFKKLGFIE